ncbi:DUF3362 domain-containing protein [Neptuniibacter marinus]|uniref:DUF3362 domain-containing protein n=1 Tax=Neptuniibacter marinus TaxID=1806670 RepID=UPI003B5BD706
MFERFSREAGKKQYLIPYFIAAHPGCEDDDMVNLAQWLKRNEFKVDQVQTFYPSPMSLATAMYHSDKNPLKKITYKSEKLYTPKTDDQRKIQKALLRYHDPVNWPLLRQKLPEMGFAHLVGDGKNSLVPAEEENTKKVLSRSKGGAKRTKRNASSASKRSTDLAVNGKKTKSQKFNKPKRKQQRSLKPK